MPDNFQRAFIFLSVSINLILIAFSFLVLLSMLLAVLTSRKEIKMIRSIGSIRELSEYLSRSKLIAVSPDEVSERLKERKAKHSFHRKIFNIFSFILLSLSSLALIETILSVIFGARNILSLVQGSILEIPFLSLMTMYISAHILIERPEKVTDALCEKLDNCR